MHNIDLDLVEMTLDVMKYAIGRISNTNPELGFPKKEAELDELVGETITVGGIGGETETAEDAESAEDGEKEGLHSWGDGRVHGSLPT